MRTLIACFLLAFPAIAQTVTIEPAVFSGQGVNDVTSGGHYAPAATIAQYVVTISETGTPDHFKWSKNGGSSSSPVAITGAVQPLSDGVTIKFGATTGHKLNDSWTITARARSSAEVFASAQHVPVAGPEANTQGKIREAVSARDFGAKGDGVSNDTAAIRLAINEVCSLRGTLYLPPGTYIISPAAVSHNPILPVCSNITITGPGTLKIANGSASYYEIMGPAGAALSNFHLSNLTIDMNSTNNPILSPGEINSYPRLVLHSGNGGSHVTVDRVHVTDVRSGWVFFIAAVNSSVTNNLIDNVGGGAVDVDSSLIYTESGATGAIVSGNRIVATSRNAGMARTGIETHASVTVADNQIQDMMTGINVVGASKSTTTGVSVTGNLVTGVYTCIALWSSSGLGATDYGLLGANVGENTCVVNQMSYLSLPGAPVGIILNAGANLPFGNLKINHNLVTFDLSSTGTEPVDQSSIGIGYWDQTNRNSCDNCDFSSNTVVNSPVSAFRFSAGGSNISFDNEIAINPGSSTNRSLPLGYYSGLFLGNTKAISGFFSVKGGTYVDNLQASRMVYGINVASASGPNPIVIDGPTVSCADVTCSSLSRAIALKAPRTSAFLRATVNVPDAAVIPDSSSVAPQSSIYSIRRGVNYLWDGHAWSYVIPHPNQPTVSSCGAGATIGGNDRAGVVVTGSGSVTSCTITFGTAFTSQPWGSFSLVTNNGSISVSSYKGSASGFTIEGKNLAGNTFMWTFPLGN